METQDLDLPGLDAQPETCILLYASRGLGVTEKREPSTETVCVSWVM